MIYYTPYKTLAMSHLDVIELNKHVLNYVINNQTKTDKYGIIEIRDGDDVPPFSQALDVFDGNRYIGTAIDVRSYLTPYTSEFTGQTEFHVKNNSEYDLARVKGALQFRWIMSHKSTFSTLSPQLAIIYANWISESVSRRFGSVDPATQSRIAIICMYFYYSLFLTETESRDDGNIENIIYKIKNDYQGGSLPSEFIRDTISAHRGRLNGIADLATAIEKLNVRFKGFNHAILITILSSTWFSHGTNYKELLAVAIEHPPSFLALVYSALNDNLYKKTGFAKMTNDRFKRDSNTFLLKVKDLMERGY